MSLILSFITVVSAHIINLTSYLCYYLCDPELVFHNTMVSFLYYSSSSVPHTLCHMKRDHGLMVCQTHGGGADVHSHHLESTTMTRDHKSDAHLPI